MYVADLCGDVIIIWRRPGSVDVLSSRVVFKAHRFSPSLPLLKQLHLLPVSYRINFKLSILTYCALSTQQPPYLASLLHLSNIPRQLRSSISQQLAVPKTKLNLGKRAFSVAAPRVWNELPITLKTSETIAIFRKKSRHSYSKLHSHHKCLVVPRSDTDFCASLFTIMLNDSVLFHL